jgi:hypothetical protein
MRVTMLSFFNSHPFRDPVLGEFTRFRGHWRGKIEIEGAALPLVLIGDRSEPNADAIALARSIAANFPAWRSVVEEALFEHYEPYAAALAAVELSAPDDPVPTITAPGEVWPHVTLVCACVTVLGHAVTVELDFTAAWDEEHTLGARFQGGRFVELCGSVLLP